MEATESPEIALKYYADILEADSANAVRAHSLHVSPPYLLSRTGDLEAAHIGTEEDRQG
jgi:hypothetical protein